jgi:hypothetical protein
VFDDDWVVTRALISGAYWEVSTLSNTERYMSERIMPELVRSSQSRPSCTDVGDVGDVRSRVRGHRCPAYEQVEAVHKLHNSDDGPKHNQIPDSQLQTTPRDRSSTRVAV